MAPNVGTKIRELRDALRETQDEFADRFGVQQATVSRWEQGRPVQRKYREAMAQLAGLTVPEFFHSKERPRLIPIVGTLAAGTRLTLADWPDPQGTVEHVKLNLSDGEHVGVRVEDDSLAPAYRRGDIVIGRKLIKTRIPDAIGRDCIVKLIDGGAFLKVLKKGGQRGLYTLRSFSPAEDDIEDVELEWPAPIVVINRAH